MVFLLPDLETVHPGNGAGDASAARQRGGGIPSLSISNNGNEGAKPKHQELTGGHKRIAQVINLEINALGKQFGIEKLGFLTLTFAENIDKVEIANKRLKSLMVGVLSKRYSRGLVVLERCKSGRIHFHLVVVLKSDIRTGLSFPEVEKGIYRSANQDLRSEWAFWRKTAPRYGFGRTELLPVKSTLAAMSRYVGKYVSKHVGQRLESDKGARLVRFFGYRPEDRNARASFAWASPRAWLWREKVKRFAKIHGCASLCALKAKLGRRWAWMNKDAILNLPLKREGVTYPTVAHYEADTGDLDHDLPASAVNITCGPESPVDEKRWPLNPWPVLIPKYWSERLPRGVSEIDIPAAREAVLQSAVRMRRWVGIIKTEDRIYRITKQVQRKC